MHYIPKITINKTEDVFNGITKGKYYSLVITKGRKYIRNVYPNIVDEINKRKFPTMTKLSYAHIPEYYTIPINVPYVDTGPVVGNPYSRYSQNTRPKWANSDQTPELLLEPFQDDRYRSTSTMADMIDMHSKGFSFEIIRDDDVIYVYRKLSMFLDTVRGTPIPKEAEEYAAYLNKIVDFLNELKRLYNRACKRKGIFYNKNGFMQFLTKASI